MYADPETLKPVAPGEQGKLFLGGEQCARYALSERRNEIILVRRKTRVLIVVYVA
jgi:hypothetical protein